MARPRVWLGCVFIAMALLWPCSSPAAAGGGAKNGAPEKAGGAAVSSEPDDERRVWIEPVAADAGRRISVRVRPGPAQPEDVPLVFACDLRSESTITDAYLELHVHDDSGALVHRDRRQLSLSEDTTSCWLTWDTVDSPEGTYAAELALFRRPGVLVARREYVVRKVSWAGLCARLEAARCGLASATDSLRALRSEQIEAPYLHMRAAIAGDCLKRAIALAQRREWRRLDALVGYLERTAQALSAQIAFGSVAPELLEAIPEPDLTRLTARDGGFYAGERPVFLLGRYYGANWPAETLGQLRKYGLNFAALDVGPQQTLLDAKREKPFRKKLDPVFKRALENNITVTVSLAPHALCSWAIDQWPHLADNGLGTPEIVRKEARKIIERHIRAAAPYLAGQEAVSSLCLLSNPKLKFTGEIVRQSFLARVQEDYGDRHAVNRAWRGLFASLDEIDIGWEDDNPRYQDTPAYRYDWQTHHQRLGAQYVRWLRQLARKRGVKMPLYLALSDDVFEIGETHYGLDREALAAEFDLGGCCAANTLSDPFYAMGYPQQGVLYALMRSLGPDRPVFNLQHRLLAGGDLEAPHPFSYVHTAMWEAALFGLSASAIDVSDLLDAPEVLEGYATACLDLNRLAGVVAAFQQAPAEVAVLWSMPSKIFDNGDPYLMSAVYAFEGCSFAGHKVRFITEDQCVRTGLAGVKVLVVPEAPAVGDEAFEVLRRYMDANRAVIRTATAPILYNAHGRSRRDIIAPTQRTVLVSGENLPTEYLHAMDAVQGFGELPLIPRITNEYGYPLEGVKSRYVEVDGQGYLYAVNIRKGPITCFVHGDRQSGRDLIRGRDVEFPRILEPLEPMLIRLDEP